MSLSVLFCHIIVQNIISLLVWSVCYVSYWQRYKDVSGPAPASCLLTVRLMVNMNSVSDSITTTWTVF